MDFDGDIQKIRNLVRQSDHVLNWEVYQQIKILFSEGCVEQLRNRSKEFLKAEREPDKLESFLNVNSDGTAFSIDKRIMDDFRITVAEKKKFGIWFADQINGHGLLISRWLSHFLGFRHRCAHVFINHPHKEDYTYIQIRSFGKADSPGKYDLLGEHAKGSEEINKTCSGGLEDELNLCLDDFIGEKISRIGHYQYKEPSNRPNFYNVEERIVFLGRIKESSIHKIRFLDDEVAGFCLCSISSLSALIKKHPEMVASGLLGSLHLYLQHKIKKKSPALKNLVMNMKGKQFNHTLMDIFACC